MFFCLEKCFWWRFWLRARCFDGGAVRFFSKIDSPFFGDKSFIRILMSFLSHRLRDRCLDASFWAPLPPLLLPWGGRQGSFSSPSFPPSTQVTTAGPGSPLLLFFFSLPFARAGSAHPTPPSFPHPPFFLSSSPARAPPVFGAWCMNLRSRAIPDIFACSKMQMHQP